jgi:hypothetical protein|eukprot:COSAG06_NODE_2793_length_6275_cov_2.145563_4_plen_83_part_00
MGIYIAFLGKVSPDKILKIASTLSSILILLAQALAPAEAVWENDAIEMKDGIKSLQETIAQQQQTLVQQQLALVRLESTCSP